MMRVTLTRSAMDKTMNRQMRGTEKTRRFHMAYAAINAKIAETKSPQDI